MARVSVQAIVDGFQAESAQQIEVLHLNLLWGAGRKIGQKHRVRVTPTSLLFNQKGELLDRQIGIPKPEQWRQKMV